MRHFTLSLLLLITFAVVAQPTETVLEGHTMPVTGVAFSPDGTLIASTGDDTSVRLWDVVTGEQIAELYEHSSFVKDTAFAPEGERLVTVGWGREVVIIDVAEQTVIDTLRGYPAVLEQVVYTENFIAFSVGDGSVRVLDADTFEETGVLELGDVLAVDALATDGDLIAVAAGFPLDNVQVWDGDERRTTIEAAATALAFLPDGQMVTADADGLVQIWETDGTAVAQFTVDAWVTALAVHDLQVAIGTLDGDIAVWTQDDNQDWIRSADFAHGATVNALAFNPDGTHLASGGDDHMIRLWQLN